MTSKEISQEDFDKINTFFQNQDFNSLYKFTKILLSKHPGSAVLQNILGVYYSLEKNWAEAEKNFKQAIKINPMFFEAYDGLGRTYINLKNNNEAIKNFKKALEIEPNFFQSHFNLANTLKKERKYKDSINSYLEVIKINPKFLGSYQQIGSIYKTLGKNHEAIEYYKKLLKINPDNSEGYNDLGNAYKNINEIDLAIENYQKSLDINPKDGITNNNIAIAFSEKFEFEKAFKHFENAIESKNKNNMFFSNYLLTMNYPSKFDFKKYMHIVQKFKDTYYLNDIDKKKINDYRYEIKPKSLKLGFVSPDFGIHPVGFFTLDIIKQLKNLNFEIFGYTSSARNDEITKDFKKIFNQWRSIQNLNDVEAINLIKNDKINILFDLSGHGSQNRISIFLDKPAPIQISWAGYAVTTGLEEIDYIVGDPYTIPKEIENQFSEKIFRMPNVWTSMSKPKFNFKKNETPALKNKYITFGSFNNLMKMNDDVIKIWCKILKAISNSKLFIKTKNLDSKEIKDKILKKFLIEGIDKNRIILEGQSNREDLLNCYNRIDVALDTFPYSGGVTSFEAVFMGVPLITLKGNSFVSKCGEAVNSNLNLKNLIASDKENYVLLAIKYTKDIAELNKLRTFIRENVLSTPLYNSEIFSKEFSKKLHEIWDNRYN